VQIKIRDTTFHTESRQCTLDVATDQAAAIYKSACALLRTVELDGRRFRLTGVGVGALEAIADAPQLELPFEPDAPAPAAQRLQGVLSAVRQRFGHQALYPAEAGAEERAGSAGGFSETRKDD